MEMARLYPHSPKKLNHINQVFTIEKVLLKMDVEPAYSPYIIM